MLYYTALVAVVQLFAGFFSSALMCQQCGGHKYEGSVRLSREECCEATPVECKSDQVCLRALVNSPYGNFFLSGCHAAEDDLIGCDYHALPHNSSVLRCVCANAECQNDFTGDCAVGGTQTTTKAASFQPTSSPSPTSSQSPVASLPPLVMAPIGRTIRGLSAGKRMDGSESVEAALLREPDRRVLSIQSHVVHGYAGNKCSIFPLQLHGFEVDSINSVQFSNHAGNVEYLTLPTRYEHVKGQKLTDTELEELYEGLRLNKINNYTHILTGYCGNVDFLKKIADVVTDIKRKDSNTFFVCDPVMGDHGKYYTPRELMPVYRDVLLPLADLLTPNAFELGELTGSTVATEEQCLAAIDVLHDKGVRFVVVTSGVTDAQSEETLCCYSSVREANASSPTRYRFTFPRLRGHFVGTGDVFTALLVAWLDRSRGDVSGAVERVLQTMQALIKRTSEFAQSQVESNSRACCELRLVQSRCDLLKPPPAEGILVERI
ncbi:unnamed protein product [Caenorhabditis auriculariae]|uniref:pyridoxal kinase n=1 Tax=Caenorhabditis auriculariae TaxID=2777116 RepID=A0A8S1GMK7_9PELO|nr:unnamed protein product [Caenorhabditis auriculariae]